jgi:hypothetical protein
MTMAAGDRHPSDTRQQSSEEAQIFLSYAREDRPRAEQVARVLGDRGWSVWWDSRVSGGQIWKEEIARALAAARCVVVLWSHASATSHWVLDEAQEGHKRGLLVPARLDDVEVPLGFRQVQTIDLADSGDDDGALDALVAAVGRVLGRPRVEPARPSAVVRRLKKWGAWAPAVLPLALLFLLHVTRVGEATVDLEVTASEVSFASAEEQEVSELLVVSDLEAAGLASLHVPRARGRPEQRVTSEGRRLGIRLVAADAPASGTITLTPVPVARGAHLTLAAGADALGYRMSFSQSSLPVLLNLQGSLQVGLPEGPPQRIDFGTPKPMRLDPDRTGAEIAIRLRDRPRNLLGSPVSVNGLSFIRIDERVRPGQTTVASVSTILSGTVRLEAAADAGRAVDAGDVLRFGESQGEIRSLQLADGGLSLRFHGRVRQLEACSRTDCESWMPTRLEAVAARQAALLVVAAVLYVLYVLVVGRRWLRIR